LVANRGMAHVENDWGSRSISSTAATPEQELTLSMAAWHRAPPGYVAVGQGHRSYPSDQPASTHTSTTLKSTRRGGQSERGRRRPWKDEAPAAMEKRRAERKKKLKSFGSGKLGTALTSRLTNSTYVAIDSII
jgi:hypothetical protein